MLRRFGFPLSRLPLLAAAALGAAGLAAALPAVPASAAGSCMSSGSLVTCTYGPYTFTVKATDAESPAMTATKTLSISVSGPVITRLRPDHGPTSGGTLVEITGTGLACPRHDRSCRVGVSFRGHRAPVLLASPGAVWVIAPPGRGTVQVTVEVGGVSSQATAAGQFTYQRVRLFFQEMRFLP